MPNSASELSIHYGGSGFSADLTPDWAGQCSLTARTNVRRRRRKTSAGRIGLTAKGLGLGWVFTGVFDDSDEVREVVSNKDGIIALREEGDINKVFAMTCTVTTIPVRMPDTGATAYQIVWTQDDRANARDGDLITTGSVSGGYIITPSAITIGDGTLAEGDFGVEGTSLRAEGAQ